MNELKSIFYGEFIGGVIAYALVVTMMLILVLAYRPTVRNRCLQFSATEFFIKCVYGFAASVRGLAEALDAALLTYRETVREADLICRSERERKLRESQEPVAIIPYRQLKPETDGN